MTTTVSAVSVPLERSRPTTVFNARGEYHTGQTNGAPLRWPTYLHQTDTFAGPSLALLLIVAAASNTDASYLRKLGGTTIATNVKTYAAYDDYAPAMLTAGLSPLCLNKKLHTAAQRHSDDMAIKDYMAHDGSDGSSMSERITQAGYVWSAVAENVAAGQVNVDAVMVAWINSPEHLENIMGEYTMFAPGTRSTRKAHTSTTGRRTSVRVKQSSATVPPRAARQRCRTLLRTWTWFRGEAETEAPTPAPTSVTDAPVTDAPATEAPVTPAPTTSTTSTPETPAQADCQSNF
ncbi:Cysteine-rich secretory protein family [Phytophthora infestans]|uniref:Cysteine-rich secretory protein family n=1 Tax=Phytophthora infestans TaxID=4787 RepID=A0A833SHZ4_PHYIN|nr:Cysteine-rich secretory protein family [Phytophthora infestans]